MFKIFVGNLDYKVRAEQVRELFAIYAPIEDLVLPTDPKTNKPRGFAIVMIRDPELGAAAIRAVQGKRLMGRELVVNEAMKKKGKADQPTAPPVRSGPFGPRLFRQGAPSGGGDPRSRGNRNPRRSFGSSSSRSTQGSRPQAYPASPPPASGPSGDAGLRRSQPPAAAGPGNVPPAKPQLPQPPQIPDVARAAVAKAKPKTSPGSAAGEPHSS